MTGHTEKLSSHSAHAPRPSFRQYLESVIAYFAESNLSIRTKILLSFFVVILLLGSIDAVVIVQGWRFNREYDAIINNITTANSINGYIKPAIDTEIWNIVAGKTAFAEGSQYVIIDEVNTKIRAMQQNTDSDRAKIKLDVILRTMDTLTHKVDRMGVLVGQGSRVFVNEQLLEEIRTILCKNISSLKCTAPSRTTGSPRIALPTG
jgi:two-component system sensor histidine kinase YesM